MSEGPARSSAASSGLDFEDTALTLRLPGSDPDRKRAASTSTPAGRSPRASASEAPPAPKYGAGGGVAAGEPEPAERAPQQGEVHQGGRGRRAVPAQGRPRGLRGLRPAARRAPGQVHLPLHRPPPGGERGDGARRRRQRGRVRAHVRGQGRRLDARRGRTLENVCGNLPASSSDEKL